MDRVAGEAYQTFIQETVAKAAELAKDHGVLVSGLAFEYTDMSSIDGPAYSAELSAEEHEFDHRHESTPAFTASAVAS